MIIRIAIKKKDHWAIRWALSFRATSGVEANRKAAVGCDITGYFLFMPRMTKSAVRLTANVMAKSNTPVRNRTL